MIALPGKSASLANKKKIKNKILVKNKKCVRLVRGGYYPLPLPLRASPVGLTPHLFQPLIVQLVLSAQ
jgi:hypothetical protein